MNYPVHKIEMLLGVEAMRHYCNILLGCTFTWITDHKDRVHLLQQWNLLGRQAQWLKHISEFNFTIQHIPGIETVLANALSRIYSNDQPGTVCMASKYLMFDEDNEHSRHLDAHPSGH